MKITVFLILILNFAQAKSIKDFDFYEYDLVFTNPICQEYFYDEAVTSNAGDNLNSKPKNAYCKKEDKDSNELNPKSPHAKLVKLIRDPDLKEIFLTFLSFSNESIAKELCDGIQRGLKVTFIIDSNNETRQRGRKQLDFLASCKSESGGSAKTYFRGNTKGLGYAHNKIIIADYKSSDKKVTLVFGSANMSSGTSLHHENWHFLTTSKESYFYQAHICVKNGMLDTEGSSGLKEFKAYLKSCRDQITVEEESDLKTFFIPSDQKQAMANIISNLNKASRVDMAVHRFTHYKLIDALVLKKDNLRFIADDDLYWSGVFKKKIGSNLFFEYKNVLKLIENNVQIKYIESNQQEFLLHHNKYIIFYDTNGVTGVHTGAGNFTKAAFSKNFENFYFITIKEIAQKFEEQYQYMFNKLATSESEMPKEYILP